MNRMQKKNDQYLSDFSANKITITSSPNRSLYYFHKTNKMESEKTLKRNEKKKKVLKG